MLTNVGRAFTLLLIVAAAVSASAGSQAPAGGDLSTTLDRVSQRVEQFYARARTITSTETVRIQSLNTGMGAVAPTRQLVYELRIVYEPTVDAGPPPEPTVLRQLVKVNGRPPRPRDEPQCMDPRSVSTEALSMLLPHRRGSFAFALGGSGRTDGRPGVILTYRSVEKGEPEVTWKDDCVSVDLPGRSRGRIWVDPLTDDVLRLDEELVGIFEFPVPLEQARRGTAGPSMTVERADSTIRYKPVTFTNPDETLMLPSSVETLTWWRNAGVARVRTTQTFSDFKRFVTEGRILEP
jgi:hypothetical protein